MVTIDQLIPVLKRLRLSGVMHTLDLREEQAREDSQQHREFMYRLLCDEIERRDSKNIATRVKQAGFPGQKVLEEFEFTFNPEIPHHLPGHLSVHPSRRERSADRAVRCRQIAHRPRPWPSSMSRRFPGSIPNC